MRPNLPKSKVKCVLIDKKMPSTCKRILGDLSINYIETKCINTINDSTLTHPDMQFLKIDENNILVENSLYSYYSSNLPDFNIFSIDNIRSPYPYDCQLNVTIIDKKCFLTEKQYKIISKYIDIEPIFVNQGYTKCNICILNENAFISSDRGIIKQAEKNGFRAYFLPNDDIGLKGYKNGFWGGVSGLIDADKVFFTGNIEKLSCFNNLMDILDKEKIEPIYDKTQSLSDFGSIIPIY